MEKTKQSILYYFIWSVYCLISILVITYTFWNKQIHMAGIFLCYIICGLPFMISRYLIKRFYHSGDRLKHARAWGILILILGLAFEYNAATSNYGLDNFVLGVFCICLSISLFTYGEY
jgi:hypothetical protein